MCCRCCFGRETLCGRPHGWKSMAAAQGCCSTFRRMECRRPFCCSLLAEQSWGSSEALWICLVSKEVGFLFFFLRLLVQELDSVHTHLREIKFFFKGVNEVIISEEDWENKKARTLTWIFDFWGWHSGPGGALPHPGKTLNMGRMVWFCQLGPGSDCKDRSGELDSPLQGWRLLIWEEGEIPYRCDVEARKPGHSVLFSSKQMAAMKSEKLPTPSKSMAKSLWVLLWAKRTTCLWSLESGSVVFTLNILGRLLLAPKKKKRNQSLYNCPDF